MSLRSTCLSNVFEVNAIGSPANSLDLQAPHIASDAGRSARDAVDRGAMGADGVERFGHGRLSGLADVAAHVDAFKPPNVLYSQNVPSITVW